MSPPADDGTGRQPRLLLGPLLRFVDERRATMWFETDRRCRVAVTVDGPGGGGRHEAGTWSVHDHHYALVRIEDLTPNTRHQYAVTLDGHEVWPLAGSPFPPSAIRTPDPNGPFRVAFGSCRRAAPFDEEHFDELGADALVGLAGRMLTMPGAEWPDVLLLLGDQIYADDPSDEIVALLRRAHGTGSTADRHPDVAEEIQNFEEYTWLYHETWTPAAVRWLLSTVPTGMVLDDHDLRDDWNTSLSWRRWVTQQAWWPDRVVGAYGSYWVYQHLGNLSPDQLDDDEVYARMLSIEDDAERTRYLDEVAWNADVDASTIRWSFYRDLGSAQHGVRLVAIDSRCSRHLDPDDRHMVDAAEWEWVRREVLAPAQPYEHLVLASTLPFLTIPGVHLLEGWDEAIAEGAWGRPGKWFGERLRQFLDLEHWSSFRASFAEFTDLLERVVSDGAPPATVSMLSGDVHCGYTAQARLCAVDHPATAIHQLTMSPFRNSIQRVAKLGNRVLNRHRPARAVRRLARWAGVEDVAIEWRVDHGPWFDNGVMTIEFAGRAGHLSIDHAQVIDGRQELRRTLDLELAPGPGDPPHRRDELATV